MSHQVDNLSAFSAENQEFNSKVYDELFAIFDQQHS